MALLDQNILRKPHGLYKEGSLNPEEVVLTKVLVLTVTQKPKYVARKS